MSTTTFNQSIATNYTGSASRTSVFRNFINWCTAQQEHRLLWLAIALAGHGCILTPLTIFAVVLAGTNLTLFITAIVAMGIALVTNLAALPTKITIPALIFSVLLDIELLLHVLFMDLIFPILFNLPDISNLIGILLKLPDKCAYQ